MCLKMYLCFFHPPVVREIDTGVSSSISIHQIGHSGATKSERAGISKLKSDMKLVRTCVQCKRVCVGMLGGHVLFPV